MARLLHVLLDQVRYDRVEAEACASGRSLAAVVFEAIDYRFPSGHAQRAAAMEHFLALSCEREQSELVESSADVVAALNGELAEPPRL